AVIRLAPHHGTVAHHFHLDRHLRRNRRNEAGDDDPQHGTVDQYARTENTPAYIGERPALGHCILGGIADQAARRADLVHHHVAGVDAGGAAYAIELQAIADVDAGRTYLHAHAAIDAITLAIGFLTLGTRAARLAALHVIGD